MTLASVSDNLRLRDNGGDGLIAGKWTDAATGEHGDLLDIIRVRCGLADFRDAVAEARRFLQPPQPETTASSGAPTFSAEDFH